MEDLMKFRSMKTLNVSGKKVLVRLDINSPLDTQTKEIINTNRIAKSIPTIEWLVSQGAKVALIAHQGDTDDYQNLITMEEHAHILSFMLNKTVVYVDDVCGPTAQEKVKTLQDGEIVLLGNLRYLAEEISVFEKVVPLEAQQMLSCYLVRSLAPLFDFYINDAFSAAHRKSPSMVAFQQVLPSAAGLLFFDEVQALSQILLAPEHPCVFVLGGSRIGDAFGMMQSVLENKTADAILTCGITGQIFLLAKGVALGDKTMSFLEKKSLLKYVAEAKTYLERFPENIYMPLDFAYLDSSGMRKEEVVTESMQSYSYGDIGSKTIDQYSKLLTSAKTIFVNGPAGIYEQKEFQLGTEALWQTIASSSAYSVVGGGDSVNAATKFTELSDWSYICTAGGAMVQFLAGKKLPLIEAMEQGTC
ncbi:MAG: phosphoglycerate kinase [Sphaerochaeta sp.]|nr:phosphoglycerate kinase [Sphaerochaeta sp.]